MISIVIGVVFIIGGLSGKLVLLGTQSGGALVAVGAGMIIWGLYKMTRQRS